MDNYVIIVAGGKGKRMSHADTPKQFLLLNGLPVLMHSIKAFYDAVEGIKIITVLPSDQIAFWKNLCEKYRFNIPHEITEGGPERFHSVQNGLQLVGNNGLVGVHDGARPLISKSMILRCFDLCHRYGNAIPAIPVKDSLRITDGALSKPVNRDKIKIIQTPQCFKSEILKKAYLQGFSPEFTDDASVVENNGTSINLVEGDPANLKITYPEDLIIASALIENSGL